MPHNLICYPNGTTLINQYTCHQIIKIDDVFWLKWILYRFCMLPVSSIVFLCVPLQQAQQQNSTPDPADPLGALPSGWGELTTKKVTYKCPMPTNL